MTNLWPSDSGLNWNLEMLVWKRGENRLPREKPLGARTTTNNKLNPYYIEPRNLAQSRLVGGTCSHHCTILKTSNLAYTMLLVQGRIKFLLKKYGFLHDYGLTVRFTWYCGICIAAIFFHTHLVNSKTSLLCAIKIAKMKSSRIVTVFCFHILL